MRTDETPYIPHYGLFDEPSLGSGSLHSIDSNTHKPPLPLGFVPALARRNQNPLLVALLRHYQCHQPDYSGYG